jgi:chromosome segregation ATPase
MEMEMEVMEDAGLASLVERLSAAASLVEQAAERALERMQGRELDLQAAFAGTSSREAALEQQLVEANATIASLKAARKTQSTGIATLQAKDATGAGFALEAGALDTALGSLSLEQRFAVKAQLLRAGLIG